MRNTNTAPDGNGRHQNPNWTDHTVDERDGTPTPEPRERNVSTITTTTTTSIVLLKALIRIIIGHYIYIAFEIDLL